MGYFSEKSKHNALLEPIKEKLQDAQLDFLLITIDRFMERFEANDLPPDIHEKTNTIITQWMQLMGNDILRSITPECITSSLEKLDMLRNHDDPNRDAHKEALLQGFLSVGKNGLLLGGKELFQLSNWISLAKSSWKIVTSFFSESATFASPPKSPFIDTCCNKTALPLLDVMSDFTDDLLNDNSSEDLTTKIIFEPLRLKAVQLVLDSMNRFIVKLESNSLSPKTQEMSLKLMQTMSTLFVLKTLRIR